MGRYENYLILHVICDGNGHLEISTLASQHRHQHSHSIIKVAFGKVQFYSTLVIDFRPSTLVKRSFSCNLIWIFSTSSERPNVSFFFGKTARSAVKDRNFIKRLVHLNCFLKIFFLTQVVFRTYSENKMWWSRSRNLFL